MSMRQFSTAITTRTILVTKRTGVMTPVPPSHPWAPQCVIWMSTGDIYYFPTMAISEDNLPHYFPEEIIHEVLIMVSMKREIRWHLWDPMPSWGHTGLYDLLFQGCSRCHCHCINLEKLCYGESQASHNAQCGVCVYLFSSSMGWCFVKHVIPPAFGSSTT